MKNPCKGCISLPICRIKCRSLLEEIGFDDARMINLHDIVCKKFDLYLMNSRNEYYTKWSKYIYLSGRHPIIIKIIKGKYI